MFTHNDNKVQARVVAWTDDCVLYHALWTKKDTIVINRFTTCSPERFNREFS